MYSRLRYKLSGSNDDASQLIIQFCRVGRARFPNRWAAGHIAGQIRRNLLCPQSLDGVDLRSPHRGDRRSDLALPPGSLPQRRRMQLPLAPAYQQCIFRLHEHRQSPTRPLRPLRRRRSKIPLEVRLSGYSKAVLQVPYVYQTHAFAHSPKTRERLLHLLRRLAVGHNRQVDRQYVRRVER